MFMCSSCSQSIAILGRKFNKLNQSIMTKAASLWYDEDMEPNLVVTASEFYGSSEDEFIPLIDEEHNFTPSDFYAEQYIAQSSITPGKDMYIPSIQSFRNPDSKNKSIFQKIYFQTDQFHPKDASAKNSLKQIASFLKRNPNTYVFIEGHCDQRASESYNLALGTKRANKIRTLIIQYGANPNRLFTVSYGKEKLASNASTKASYAKNRRVAFKLYSKDKN